MIQTSIKQIQRTVNTVKTDKLDYYHLRFNVFERGIYHLVDHSSSSLRLSMKREKWSGFRYMFH